MKAISIIVPVYNLDRYLDRCINSILSQTYSNIEIVVVDDGSKDNSSNIIKAFANKYSNIVPVFKKNGGVTSARLAGVKKATGEYIGFVDGDDYVEPEMFEKLLENMIKYNADISHCGYQMVFPSRVDYYYNSERLIIQDKISGLKDLLEGTFIEPGLWNKLFKRSLFNELLKKNIIDESIKINEDLLMNYYLFTESNKSVYLDKCYYHYIVRANSAANKTMNEYKLKNPIDVLKILQKDTENNILLNQIVNKRLIYQMINIATLSLGEQKSLIFPYRKQIRRELRRNIIKIITDKTYKQKLKIMAIWTVICPSSYRWVHTLYMKITGIDKKYKLD